MKRVYPPLGPQHMATEEQKRTWTPVWHDGKVIAWVDVEFGPKGRIVHIRPVK